MMSFWLEMIEWINNNNGFLMVIITLVYVVATVFICIFNGKSAKASQEQIIASQKQQEQNAGLQLYAIRQEAINKIGKHQFDEVFWDISLLFDESLFNEFANIGVENNKLNRLKIEIKWFEDELEIILPKAKLLSVITQISVAKIQREYSDLGASIKSALGGTNNKLALNSVDEYTGNLEKADELQTLVDAKTMNLILKLRKFTQDSIKLKVNVHESA